MKKLILTALMTLTLTVPAQAETLKLTCYCPESCGGTITASGAHVRTGIVATGREHLGDCAMIYTVDGEFLGYYECLDIGGTDAIRKGYVIDMWVPNLQESKNMMLKTEGEVEVVFVEQPKG